MRVPDKCYSRNVPCTLNLISTFLLLSLERYLCCSTISSRGYYTSSSQSFGTDMVYQIYILYKKFTIPKSHLLTQAQVTSADFGYPGLRSISQQLPQLLGKIAITLLNDQLRSSASKYGANHIEYISCLVTLKNYHLH